jgi:hypothetical protein
MPFRPPDRLFVLFPRLQDGAAVYVEGLDGAAVAAGDYNAPVAPDVARVCDVVYAEAIDCF